MAAIGEYYRILGVSGDAETDDIKKASPKSSRGRVIRMWQGTTLKRRPNSPRFVKPTRRWRIRPVGPSMTVAISEWRSVAISPTSVRNGALLAGGTDSRDTARPAPRAVRGINSRTSPWTISLRKGGRRPRTLASVRELDREMPVGRATDPAMSGLTSASPSMFRTHGETGRTAIVRDARRRRSSDGVNVYNYDEITIRVPPRSCTGDVPASTEWGTSRPAAMLREPHRHADRC